MARLRWLKGQFAEASGRPACAGLRFCVTGARAVPEKKSAHSAILTKRDGRRRNPYSLCAEVAQLKDDGRWPNAPAMTRAGCEGALFLLIEIDPLFWPWNPKKF